MLPLNSDETANPLVSKWQGPYGGVPPFDQVQVALFKPALEAAMAAQLAETERIARNAATPTLKTQLSPSRKRVRS
jgi:peptidyl-dipeptidase Dcp